MPARAEIPRSPSLAFAPECMRYRINPGSSWSASAWDRMVSFATCIQDARVARIEHADQLPGLVEQLHEALAPSVELYVTVVERGPAPVKLRAAYHVGLTYVALLTRARSSIAAPDPADAAAVARHRELHASLEPLLEPFAKLVWLLFTAIDRAVAEDPALVPDAVTRYMVRSARELAEQLGRSWSRPLRIPDAAPRLAGPR
jgi:hypothetical protein